VSRRLVSVDPGKHKVAWALFVDGVLHTCGSSYSKGSIRAAASVPVADAAVVEVPQVYARSKGDPNDLVDVAVMAGAAAISAAAAAFCPTTFVRPCEWKGQTPKSVCWKRARNVLTDEEVAAQEAGYRAVTKSEGADVRDAVALGLWALGRTGR
jgi:hypothetical protein